MPRALNLRIARFTAALCLTSVVFSRSAQAHFFAQPYTLPVPFWMYAWGAAAALILSFIVVGVFAGAPTSRPIATGESSRAPKAVPALLIGLGRIASVTALVACVITGWLGTQIALENINMTIFWIMFVLGVAYLCAFAGNFYAAINPWRVLVGGLERVIGKPFTGAFPLLPRLGYWPALAFYAAFIAIELFAQLSPSGLANALVAYTILNVIGSWAFGTGAWFHYGEFFGVFLRLLGAMAPVTWSVDVDEVRVSPRRPLSELGTMKAESMSLVIFILFMLSSTAYDGLHSTEPWVDFYWRDLYPPLAPLLGAEPADQIATGTQVYHLWQAAMLPLSPFIYLIVFLVCIALAKRLARSSRSVTELALWFAPSLVPIAFVYHVTHYYPLLLSQGAEIVRLVSDPLGKDWNIFGTARLDPIGLMLPIDFIWHSQVGLILLGHIVSVYLAHMTALRVFGDSRSAAKSQVPMLFLMVLFTTFGLWILSLPLTAGVPS